MVVGFTEPKGSRTGFGALHLAAYRRVAGQDAAGASRDVAGASSPANAADDAAASGNAAASAGNAAASAGNAAASGNSAAAADAGDPDGRVLHFIGSVGTGFRDAQLRDTESALREIVVDQPPCQGAPTGAEHTWVEPVLVAEVRYHEVTDDGLLRQPAFLRFRDDKDPDECHWPGVDGGEESITREGEYAGGAADVGADVGADKPMGAGDRALPGSRPGTKTDTNTTTPSARTETIYSEGSERDLDYFICDDRPSLLYVANAASIPLHIWSSRVPALERPDWAILDLDPKDAPFTDVVEVANALHAVCDEIDLSCFVKTSGSSGLHVLIPTAGNLTHEQARQLAELLARIVVHELPEIATITRVISKREGRVYLDYLQNGWGKLLVAPFSVRPVSGARVSAPLRWKEVTPSLDIGKYTITSMPRRMAQLKEDPFRGVLDERPDLIATLERLQARL